MSTEKPAASAASLVNSPSPRSISANDLLAAGLTLKGTVISAKDNPKTWEGKTTMWTELGVSDGENVYVWKVKHPEFDKGVRVSVPKLLTSVTVRVTYCATEKGQISFQGQMVA